MKKLIILSRLFLITLLILFFTASAFADYNFAKVVHHLGKKIPLDLQFTNSKGEKVVLKDIIKKPTVLDFCYYRCSGICLPLMVEIADVIGKVKYEPGKDYNIISISIDQNETTKMAAKKKNAMVGLVNKQIPDSAWTFLTGDSANIYALTNTAGFYFKRIHGGFTHKGVLIFLDKNGKIVRYLDPSYQRTGDFQILRSEFEFAIKEASEGKVTSTIAKVLKTCISFIPTGNARLVLILILVSGLLTLTTVIIIIKKMKPRNG